MGKCGSGCGDDYTVRSLKKVPGGGLKTASIGTWSEKRRGTRTECSQRNALQLTRCQLSEALSAELHCLCKSFLRLQKAAVAALPLLCRQRHRCPLLQSAALTGTAAAGVVFRLSLLTLRPFVTHCPLIGSVSGQRSQLGGCVV